MNLSIRTLSVKVALRPAKEKPQHPEILPPKEHPMKKLIAVLFILSLALPAWADSYNHASQGIAPDRPLILEKGMGGWPYKELVESN